MRPFELPDLYMPYRARLNPHLDSAREHTTKWARVTGLLDEETAFEDHDYALLGAYVPPDVPASRLNLLAATVRPTGTEAELEPLADWSLWARFIDGLTPASTAVRHQHLRRPARSLTPGAVTSPNTTDPAERGLAELWHRTLRHWITGELSWLLEPERHRHDTVTTTQSPDARPDPVVGVFSA
ncbi:germacradienol/geosmin synthase [Actinopolyspora xinjiangensis]|uniref:Germacradienol/geosmin synthase n=1 Tax=Actinopolyspora xinjiangensis TaxID=405564 RepID=A0A1H0REJ4_9ACTN|nr:hypothetical protein [Actinopolyspora xinjiangensis]SDP27983.1 germacradienol/geosmin synthase [Actinopolyspora xinjiangensis]